MKKTIYILSVLILSSYSFCYALTRGEIREQIRWTVGDVAPQASTMTYRWSDDILNKRINIVQEEIASLTKCIVNRSTNVALIANQREYILPDDALNIIRVAFWITGSTASHKSLEWRSIGGLDNEMPFWETLAGGIPLKYYQRGKYIGLVPPPSSSYAATGNLKIDYVARPQPLSNDSDIPFNSDPYLYPYHKLIVLGVAIMCFTDDGNANMTAIIENKYYTLLNRMIEDVNYQPDKKQNMILFSIPTTNK